MAFKQCVPELYKPTLFSPMVHLYLSLFPIITIIIAVVFKLKLVRRFKIKPNDLNLPPSPTKLPIIGNLHQLGTLRYRSFRSLSQKCGAADLMLLHLGNTPTLVVSSAEAVSEITKAHDLAFSNRPQSTATKTLLYGCTDIGFSPYGETWKHKRKICVRELLNPKRVQSFRFIREESVEELVNKLREASSNDDACSVNLSEMLIETANIIICKCALGLKFSATKDSYSSVKELARKAMIQLAEFTVGDHFPLLGWVDVLSGKTKEFKATFAALDALFDEVIAEHKRIRREADGNEKDFVDILIQVQEGGMPGFELTNNDIKAILLDMFTAGSDPIAVALEWAMTELVKNPITLKKAQEEVRRVTGRKSRVEESEINQMNYLKCVLKETLRLHPAAPLLAPRETSSHVNLKGYDILAKTPVHVNAWAIHRDPEFWERPEEFIPERHDGNGQAQVQFKGQDFQFIPFGFGRRGCPGMTFGLASTEYVLANLLYFFNWKLPPTTISEQGIDMSETFGLLASKKVPLHLKPIAFAFE